MLNILLKAEKASSKTNIHIGRLDTSTCLKTPKCKHPPMESSGLGTNGYSITIWLVQVRHSQNGQFKVCVAEEIVPLPGLKFLHT